MSLRESRDLSALKFPFLEQERDEEALGFVFVPNDLPTLESDLNGVDFLQHISSAPLPSIVVVGDLALLIHLNERLGDDVDVPQNGRCVILRGWRVLAKALGQVPRLVATDVRHGSVL